MQELEKILEEIEQRKTSAEKLIVKPPHDKLDQVANDTAEAFIEAYKECQDIIRKHMNDGWISVDDRLPEVGEYVLGTTKLGEVLIFRYGWNNPRTRKMFFHLCGSAADIIAWCPLPDPYRPERSDSHDGK